MRTLFLSLILASLTSITLAQPASPVKVFNYSNADQLKAYESLELDSNHPNLLATSKQEKELKEVIAAWQSLHQALAAFLIEQNFDWQVSKEQIALLHKIYFSPEGTITHYFFRVLNPSMPTEKQEELARLIEEFAQGYHIELSRPYKFAQCGKSRMST